MKNLQLDLSSLPDKKNKLLKYLTAFFSSEVLLFLGSFISFPIFTRILCKTDYGIMSLIGVTIALAGHISDLGMKDAVLRLYSSYSKEEKNDFISSIFNFFLVTSLSTISLLWIFAFFCKDKIVSLHVYSLKLVLLASCLITFRGVFGIISAVFRIEERVRAVIFFDFFQRYGGVILSVSFVIVYENLFGYYLGLVAAEAILTVIMIYLVRKNISFGLIKRKYIFSSIKYGFPLSISNISSFLISSGDRYVVGFFFGPAAVATYSVAYNLCNYIFELIKNMFFKTFMPLVINNWNRGEISQSQKTLSLHFRLYLMIALPAVFGLAAIGADALALLAGTKYKDAFFLVPVLASAIAVNGLSHVTFSGMYYKSQSRCILQITFGTAILNLLLNVFLLRIIGLIGAAWATGISYLLMVLAGYCYSKQALKINYQLCSIVKYTVFSMIMFWIIKVIPLSGNSGLIVKIVVGILSYGLLALSFDLSFLRKEVLNFQEE